MFHTYIDILYNISEYLTIYDTIQTLLFLNRYLYNHPCITRKIEYAKDMEDRPNRLLDSIHENYIDGIMRYWNVLTQDDNYREYYNVNRYMRTDDEIICNYLADNLEPCSLDILRYIFDTYLNVNVVIDDEEHLASVYVSNKMKSVMLSYTRSIDNIKFIEHYTGTKLHDWNISESSILEYCPSYETVEYIYSKKNTNARYMVDMTTPEYTYRYCQNIFQFYDILHDTLGNIYNDKWIQYAAKSNHAELYRLLNTNNSDNIKIEIMHPKEILSINVKNDIVKPYINSILYHDTYYNYNNMKNYYRWLLDNVYTDEWNEVLFEFYQLIHHNITYGDSIDLNIFSHMLIMLGDDYFQDLELLCSNKNYDVLIEEYIRIHEDKYIDTLLNKSDTNDILLPSISHIKKLIYDRVYEYDHNVQYYMNIIDSLDNTYKYIKDSIIL